MVYWLFVIAVICMCLPDDNQKYLSVLMDRVLLVAPRAVIGAAGVLRQHARSSIYAAVRTALRRYE